MELGLASLVSLVFGFVLKEQGVAVVLKSLVLVVVVVVAEKSARAVDVLTRYFCMGRLWIVDWGFKGKERQSSLWVVV